jgi:hypothetical protein
VNGWHYHYFGKLVQKKPGDDAYNEILYPVAARILTRCDAVLRLEGASSGADEDVRIAKELGLQVYYKIEDIPGC